MSAAPLSHTSRANLVSNLGLMLISRFGRTGDFDDLQQAILHLEEGVTSNSPDQTDRSACLGNLGKGLYTRYGRTEDIEDLQLAISRTQDAVGATPPDDSEFAISLNNLGTMLRSRFDRNGDLNDLQLAISRMEEAVVATPVGHYNRAAYLSNLGDGFSSKFDRTEKINDLQLGISRTEQAVAEAPQDHPDRADYLNNLAERLLLRHSHAEDPDDCDRAISCLRESVTLHSAATTSRIDAALVAISFLDEDRNLIEASEITRIAVNLLPRISPRALRQTDQQHMIKKYAGLASHAAAAALQVGRSATDAVQLLEIGRGVIANLQFESRTDLHDLREQHPQIAKEFEKLRDDLDMSNNQSLVSKDLTILRPSRYTTSLELDNTVDKIRQLPNFQRFLCSPTAEELMMAAAPMHPVVLINVSSFRCDAFIIQHQNISVLNLSRLLVSDIEENVELLRRGLRTRQLFELLEWLWDVAACPILEKLGFCESVMAEWPRICWVPTGPLCHLPIHAAGYHCKPGCQTVLDQAVSSYSPSIKALLYARRNAAQRIQTQACSKAVLVLMNRTPGCTELAFATKELNELESLIPDSLPKVILHRPSKEQVLNALQDCTVFHFAGHGQSHPLDPSMSTLLMSDWQKNPLTVKDLVAMKFHQNPPLLAYLSACSTGNNQVDSLVDEGIHLMGACQLAGFRNVIGSLWEVSDKHCVDAAKDVYETMIKAGMSDESISLGLHNAVMNLRGGRGRTGMNRDARNARLIETEESLETRIGDPFIWAAYIHMGI